MLNKVILTGEATDPTTVGQGVDKFVDWIKVNPVLAVVTVIVAGLVVSSVVLFVKNRKRSRKRK